VWSDQSQKLEITIRAAISRRSSGDTKGSRARYKDGVIRCQKMAESFGLFRLRHWGDISRINTVAFALTVTWGAALVMVQSGVMRDPTDTLRERKPQKGRGWLSRPSFLRLHHAVLGTP
jgi:hypothetical protein